MSLIPSEKRVGVAEVRYARDNQGRYGVVGVVTAGLDQAVAGGGGEEASPNIVVTHSCPHSLGVGMVGNPYLADDVERHCVRKGFNPGPITDCGEPSLLRLWGLITHRPREWIFGHFHAHREVLVQEVRFHCIGALDGSDNRSVPVGYVLDTHGWLFTPVALPA